MPHDSHVFAVAAFNGRIAKLLADENYTQGSLAVALGITEATLSHKMTRHTPWKPREIGRMAEIFEEWGCFASVADKAAFLDAGHNALAEAQMHKKAQSPLLSPTATTPVFALPVPATPLIGRADAIAQVVTLLQHAHLVTLHGPGGVGKTRLALAVAEAIKEQAVYPDGIAFVDLAPLTGADAVMPAIARSLDISLNRQHSPRDQVQTYLVQRHLLLVLDNFEHLPQAWTDVDFLLTRCPQMVVLVTSRVVLGVRQERCYRVDPLPLPAAEAMLTREIVMASPAVMLFLDRVHATVPEFEVTAENASAVAAICRRLDGLPLALELAAPRLALYAPQHLSQLLERPLDGLGRGIADLPERQQTVEQTIAWSYALLVADERHLFARLAVFPESWTLAAAQAVCAPDDPGLAETLLSLVNQSLVLRSVGRDGVPRFAMLKTIHDFARDRLGASGEEHSLQQRLLMYMLTQVEGAYAAYRGPEQENAVRTLDTWYVTIQAILAWAISRADTEAALRFCTALWPYWNDHGLVREGRESCRATLALASSHCLPSLRGWTLIGLAYLTWRAADYAQAREQAMAALALMEECPDTVGMGYALLIIAESLPEDEKPRMEHLLRVSADLCREAGDSWATGWVLYNLSGTIIDQERLAEAEALLQESYALLRPTGDRKQIAMLENMLGEAARCRGDDTAADMWYRRSLATFTQLGHKTYLTYLYHNLGQIALHRQDTDMAAHFFDQALSLAVESTATNGIIECLAGFVGVLGQRGEDTEAAILIGAIENQCQALAIYLGGVDKAEYMRNVALVQSRLSVRTYEEATRLGRMLSLDEAVALPRNG